MNLYKVNPFCPNCHEEHNYYQIEISDEEQEIVNQYYRERRGKSSLAIKIEEINNPALVVIRDFKCSICKAKFKKAVTISKYWRIDNRSELEKIADKYTKEELYIINKVTYQFGYDKGMIISLTKLIDNLDLSPKIIVQNMSIPNDKKDYYIKILNKIKDDENFRQTFPELKIHACALIMKLDNVSLEDMLEWLKADDSNKEIYIDMINQCLKYANDD
jgi:hypothetical protein